MKEVGAAYVPPSIQNPPMFAGGGIELFDIVQKMDGVKGFGEEWEGCAEVTVSRIRLKLLSLEHILKSKRAANRLKDRMVIPVLEDSIAALMLAKEKKAANRKRVTKRVRHKC